MYQTLLDTKMSKLTFQLVEQNGYLGFGSKTNDINETNQILKISKQHSLPSKFCIVAQL